MQIADNNKSYQIIIKLINYKDKIIVNVKTSIICMSDLKELITKVCFYYSLDLCKFISLICRYFYGEVYMNLLKTKEKH